MGLHVKVSVILLRFERNLNFFDRFGKNIEISNFVKPRPVGAKLFEAEGPTDMTNLTVAFYNFANVPKNGKLSHYWLRPS